MPEVYHICGYGMESTQTSGLGGEDVGVGVVLTEGAFNAVQNGCAQSHPIAPSLHLSFLNMFALRLGSGIQS
jgi:hypothetical protein